MTYQNQEIDAELFVLVVGAPFCEQQFIGPFNSFDEADDYSRNYGYENEFTWIQSMTEPKGR